MTRRLLRNEDGFTLSEILIAMTIMLIVMGATLASLDSFRGRQKLDSQRSESQESLRRGIDHLERQLRNLATPQKTIKSIYRAGSNDIIFQTADPQKRWVRYCIDPADTQIATGKASLWYGIYNVPLASSPPSTTSCPGASSGWTTESVGTAVVNARDGLARPLFAYNWPKSSTGAPITTDTSAITRVRTDLWVDVNPGANPVEQRLSSGVYLRNQNQAPVPRFTAVPAGANAAGYRIVLNASSTSDFEGRRLNYYWYYGSSPAIPASGCKPASDTEPSYLGSGIVLEALIPLAVSSPQNITLCVIDPGDLEATLTKQVAFS